MDIIVSLVPVPGLCTAFSTFRALWDAIYRAQWSEHQLRALATSIAELLQALNGAIETGTILEAQVSPEMDALQRLIKEIHCFVVHEEGRNFLKLLFSKDERISAIEIYHRRLCACVNAFQISALLDIRGWQKRNDDSQDTDRKLLYDRLTELEANQVKLRDVLDVHHNNMLAMMTSLQKFVVKRLCGEREQRFFESTLKGLEDISGRVVADIESWMVTSFEVEFGPEIGSGGFGQVFKGIWNRTDVALKVLKTDSGATPSLALIRREIKTWSGLLHPNILQFLGANVFDDRPFIVMPFLKNGNARDYIHEHPSCNRVSFLHHISLGLVYLHRSNVMHGDLKALNVLIDDAEHAVLCDFGLSCLKSDATSRSVSQSITSIVGSRNWMSPERIRGGELRTHTDIYAFGMTMFEILTGNVPLGHIAYVDFIELVVNQDVRPERPDDDQLLKISDGLWALMESCWAKAPKSRPTAIVACDTISSILNSHVDAPRLEHVSTSVTPHVDSDSRGIGQRTNLSVTTSGSDSSSATTQLLGNDLDDGPLARNAVRSPGSQTSRSSQGSLRGSRPSTMGSSLRLTRVTSTRPTTAESMPSSSNLPSPLSPYAEPLCNNDEADTSDVENRGVPLSPSTIVQEPLVASLGANREMQGDNQNIIHNPKADGLRDVRLPVGNRRPFESIEGLRNPTTGTPTVSHVREGTRWGWSARNEDTVTPKVASLRRNSNPADSESLEKKPRGFRRMTSWLGNRSPNAHAHSASPVQRGSGFKPLPGRSPHNPREVPEELWSLDDLVERLILRTTDISRDEEFRNVFLATYPVFTNCQEVFEQLRRRFEIAAIGVEPASVCAFRRQSIIFAMKYWITSSCAPTDPEVLVKMKEFASSVTSSSFMSEKAKELIDVINGKTEEYPLLSTSGSVTSLSLKGLLDNTPKQIADALTTLEGVMFGRIRPADYIYHVQELQRPNRVVDAFRTSQQIVYWVKERFLRSDKIKVRGKVFKFFLRVAEDCYQTRNFSSTASIILALESDPVQSLQETLRELDTQDQMILAKLSGFLKSETAYHAAVSPSEDPCIPRLDYHIHNFRALLPSCLLHTDETSVAQINLMGCISLSAALQGVIKIRYPPVGEATKPERLLYLLGHLGSVEVNAASNENLRRRSRLLRSQEISFAKSRTRGLEAGGFLGTI